MSTSFAKMEAKLLNTQAVAGKISKVGPFIPSKGSDGTYITGPVEFSAYGAGQSQKIYLTFRPEWLSEKFHIEVGEAGGSVEKYFQDNFGDQEYTKTDGSVKNAAKSFSFVYQSNIANGDNTSFLQSIFPDDEAFEAFVQSAFKQNFDPAEPDLDAVNAFFESQLMDKKMGYIMSQKKIRTQNTDANGKAIYLRDNTREVKSYFPITKKKIESLVKSAKTSKTGFTLTFDPDMVLD
jgi:hypothetical protein